MFSIKVSVGAEVREVELEQGSTVEDVMAKVGAGSGSTVLAKATDGARRELSRSDTVREGDELVILHKSPKLGFCS